MTAIPKPSRTDRKLKEAADRKAVKAKEDSEKAKVRRRDRRCRFPLCGCAKFKLSLHVAHLHHKGMGSKAGVSTADQMILLCSARHQDNAISWHKGTLRAEPLGPLGTDGPVRWLIDVGEVGGQAEWWEVARELRPGRLEILNFQQALRLESLAKMTI